MGIGVHTAYYSQFVHHLGGVWQKLRECGATLTVTSKGIHARSDWKTRLAGGHGGQALTLPDGFGQVLVKPLFHLGFVIIQIQLRGST